MQFLKKLFSNPHFDSELTGIWESDPEEIESIEEYGNVRLTFGKNGQLTHEIILHDRIQKINLVYWTQEGVIYTDQPSSPGTEITKYRIENDILILDYQGIISRYNRQIRPKCAP